METPGTPVAIETFHSKKLNTIGASCSEKLNTIGRCHCSRPERSTTIQDKHIIILCHAVFRQEAFSTSHTSVQKVETEAHRNGFQRSVKAELCLVKVSEILITLSRVLATLTEHPLACLVLCVLSAFWVVTHSNEQDIYA